MSEIEISRTPHKRKRVQYQAFQGKIEVGSFDYLPSENTHKPVKMGLLHVQEKYWGQGIGGALLREFGKDVGLNTVVTAVVSHEDTLVYLERFNPDLEAKNKLVYNLSDPDLIREVPISRVLKSGRIEVVRYRIIYNSKEDRLRSFYSIHGVTLKGIIV